MAGRLEAGTGLRHLEIFVDGPKSSGAAIAVVAADTRSGALTIGGERTQGLEVRCLLIGGASLSVVRQDYVGDIARLLIYDRDLSDEALQRTGGALTLMYGLSNNFTALSGRVTLALAATFITETVRANRPARAG